MKQKKIWLWAALVLLGAGLAYHFSGGKSFLPQNNPSGAVLFIHHSHDTYGILWELIPESGEPSFVENNLSGQLERWEGNIVRTEPDGYTVNFSYKHGSDPAKTKMIFFPRNHVTQTSVFPSLQVEGWYGDRN